MSQSSNALLLMNINIKQQIVRMLSNYINRKYTPNILVRFGQTSVVQNPNDVCSTLRQIVHECYGKDRFVVYSVSDDDLKCDSRTWSAAGMIDFSSSTFQNNHNLSIPILELKPEALHNQSELWKELLTFFNDHIEPFKLNQQSSKNISNDHDKKPTEVLVFSDTNSHVLSENSISKNTFDYRQYCAELRTTGGFGRTVHFQDITTSTMDLIKNCLNVNGSLAVCNYQLSGIGRNDNQWLSPEGCAMWTVNLIITVDNPLFKRISLLQHITSLAILQSIPFHKELELFIKWPNDILYRTTNSKLCGIITKSQFNKSINVQIGIGLNLDNRSPSICLNELIDFYNENHPESSKLSNVKRETLIANFMNNLQNLLSLICDNTGLEQFKELYLQNWIHDDSVIKLHDRRGDDSEIVRKARIVSIDDFGFLSVCDLKTGKLLSLQPDGNRFDLMNNLVVLNQ